MISTVGRKIFDIITLVGDHVQDGEGDEDDCVEALDLQSFADAEA